MSEKVNGKCPSRNTILQFCAPYTDPHPQTLHPKIYIFIISHFFDHMTIYVATWYSIVIKMSIS